MANVLKMAVRETILALYRRGWSQRKIAAELDINRETVARYLQQAESAPKPAIAPIGSDTGQAALDSGRASAPGTSETQFRRGGRTSECRPLEDVIQGKCELGLSAQRIYQDLVSEHDFSGSYYSVRRFVRRLDEKLGLPFRRIEKPPGEEAQVNFGTGAPVIGPDGKRRKTYVLRVVLSHSRKAYSEAVYRQTTDDFLRCLEGAFRHFRGTSSWTTSKRP